MEKKSLCKKNPFRCKIRWLQNIAKNYLMNEKNPSDKNPLENPFMIQGILQSKGFASQGILRSKGICDPWDFRIQGILSLRNF